MLCNNKTFHPKLVLDFTASKANDSLEAIAHIYEIKLEYQKAIGSYQRIIELLKTDWNITFGASINKYAQKIDELNLKQNLH